MITGRTALITGAGNGIGRAIALDLARNGAAVVAAGRTVENLEETAAIAEGDGYRIEVQVCDVADAESVAQLARRLQHSEVSILVNNAGVAGPVKDLVSIETAEWDETFAANVRGVFHMCRAFLPGMIERREGDIVNISSVSGKRPLPKRTPYCASKMAVIGLTNTLAWEVGVHGVKVNSVSPGPVDGPRIRNVLAAAGESSNRTLVEVTDEFLDRTAMKRMLTEHEVAIGVRNVIETQGLTAADLDLSAGMVGR